MEYIRYILKIADAYAEACGEGDDTVAAQQRRMLEECVTKLVVYRYDVDDDLK